MAGDGRRAGYLHATAPTKTKKGSDVYRLREDNACGVTIRFSAPLGPHRTVAIVFSTGDGRVIDRFDSTQYSELPTEATLSNEQTMQQDRSPLSSDRLSQQRGFRVWRNPDGTLEVSAIRARAKHWDTGRTVAGEPLMYRFDLLVDDTDVPLSYCFDRRCKHPDGEQLHPDCPGRGMFFAGSVRLTDWLVAQLVEMGFDVQAARGALRDHPRFQDALNFLVARAAPGGSHDATDARGGRCATALAIPATAVRPVASQRPQSTDLLEQTATAGLFDDTLTSAEQLEMLPMTDWTSAEQLEMLPMADWTPDEIMLLQHLLSQ